MHARRIFTKLCDLGDVDLSHRGELGECQQDPAVDESRRPDPAGAAVEVDSVVGVTGRAPVSFSGEPDGGVEGDPGGDTGRVLQQRGERHVPPPQVRRVDHVFAGLVDAARGGSAERDQAGVR